MNIIAQLIIGTMMEHLLTLQRVAAIYMLSGLGGVVAGCLWSDDLSVGASGAIIGLCGAFVLFFDDCVVGVGDIELGDT